MRIHRLFAAAVMTATLGMTAHALGAVGDPTGTTYGVSGRNYGSADFGYGLLFESEYTISDGGFTGDAQLDGTGAPVTLTFDGVPEVINGIEFNESYGVWDPGTNGVPTAYNVGLGVNPDAQAPVPFWDRPHHAVEFKVRDTLGTINDGGGINRNPFFSAILRYDGVSPDATTPSGANDAIPFIPADRDPQQQPNGFDGNATGFYFYYEKNGVPANPDQELNIPTGILRGDHFDNSIGASQQVFYIVYSDGQADDDVTHDIASGIFGLNSDTERELQAFANLITLGSVIGYNFPESEYDTIVLGLLYDMVAPGDGDNNGVVDGLDYLRWAANYGTTPTNVPLPTIDGDMKPIEEAPSPDGRLDFKRFYGDYNNSGGPVDGLDYLVWASNYGFVGNGSDTLSAAVPEPSTLVLAGCALAGLGLSVRRRR
ncbi:MAG: PEP-CTERM sorting domain-containing protein [Planctomycetales bacterium]|nr:PEP-CTERM sorting domain-containing protein [Planctomycetales bacterium]